MTPPTLFATNLVTLDAPAPDDIVALEDRLNDFNAITAGADDGRYLSIFLKRDDGSLYAGLHGHTWDGVCEIKTLWVTEKERGRGLGSCLLIAAEMEARRRGCSAIHLSSFTFQAPDFYENTDLNDSRGSMAFRAATPISCSSKA